MKPNNQSSSEVLRVLKNVSHAIVGKDAVILRVFLAMLARGHILLEDVPGVGKTTLAVAFSKALALKYSRIQFTPDILPSDITGYSVYDKNTGRMSYVPGAILCNLFLADELNRANSRTQSALLEAMEEGQVTVDGVTHAIRQPFIVIATQNPVGAAGTQLLPESQMDRFMVRLSLGYPEHNDELSLLKRKQGNNLLSLVQTVLNAEEVENMRAEVDKVHIDQAILNYIVQISNETRRHRDVVMGASPRASLALAAIAKAMAFVQGRDYVIPKDISPLATDTLAHRLVLRPGAENDGVTAPKIIDGIMRSVHAPQIR